MTATPPASLLSVRDLSIVFDGRHGPLTALDGVSFDIAPGEILGVVGESGAGKSLTGTAVIGLLDPPGRISGGSIHLDGQRIDNLPPEPMRKLRGRRIGAIFQDPLTSLHPLLSVGDIIAEPIRELKLRKDEAATTMRVGDLLEIVGLSRGDATRFPHEFSGGQRQRISIARALATEADVLVCDEPTSALDVSVQAQILNLMVRLQKEFGLTYLFISHNLSVVRHMSDYLAIMYLGRFVETGPADQVFGSPRHPYTRLLLDTIPDVETPNRERRPMSGEVPSPIAPPPGCAFHPRCGLAFAPCSRERPLLTVSGASAVACHLA